MNTQARSFGRRVNEWLSEAPGEQFKHNKWKFWFVALICFSILNAALTALVFNAGGVLQTYMGTVLVGVGALLAWLGVCALYYSDSTDRRLSWGVAVLDSITLLFVVGHFSFLMWVYGHLSTLKNAEAEYKTAIATYNVDARQVQADNARIAEALRQVAVEDAKRARIENDTIYQARKAAQAGAKVETRRGQSLGAGLATSPVELAKPPDPPADSSAAYLTRWDSAIRLANFGELALAIITMIFIRVRSSLTNSPRVEEFPDELDADVVADRRSSPRLDRTRKRDSGLQSPLSLSFDREKARYALLEHLKTVSFHYPRHTFKVDLIAGGVIIRMVRKEHGVETTVASTTQSNKLLAAVDRPDFRERLVDELIRQNFPIEKDDVI
jgi:hypothetical protein